MRKIAIIALFALSIFVFSNSSKVLAQENKPKLVKKKPVYVLVRSGDSLSKIANKHKTTYKRVFYANKKITDPNLIYPGQKIRIPHKNEKLKPRGLDSTVVDQSQPIVSNPSIPETTSQPATNYSPGNSVWDQLAACESGGNWAINTGNGYYGGLQFSLSSWRGVGGSGYPHQASKAEQIKRAEILRSSGGWGHWPACAAKLGLI